jgi:glycosyltransferase involved in cell wall biosynthesis
VAEKTPVLRTTSNSARAGDRERATPFVSFVVPVRNEERHIRACLESLIAQQYPSDRFEIVVVDGQSTDKTRAIVGEVAAEHEGIDLRLLGNPARSVGPGRNLGIRAARGEAIVFVEGHARLDAGFLATVADCLARTGARCLGRYVEQLIPEDNAVQRATGMARKSWLARNPHSGRFAEECEGWISPLGVATVYRSDVFGQFGAYDESLTTNEDVELNYRLERAGVLAWRSPRLRYRLHPRETLGALFAQMYRYGAGKRRFTRLHPAGSRVTYLAPTLLCASALSALLALSVGVWLAGLLAVPSAVYLGLAGGIAVRARRHGVRTAALVPLVMATMVVGFGLGYGIELARDVGLRFGLSGGRGADGREKRPRPGVSPLRHAPSPADDRPQS